MKLTKKIIVTGTFIEFHKWPDAIREVSYLGDLHRHVFTFKVEFAVEHNDRQREFHIEKERAAALVATAREHQDVTSWSCEAWAEYLLKVLEADAVEIWEDNENGARVEKV